MTWIGTISTLAQSGSWLDRLLGLTRLSWSDERAMLGWRYELPGWVWIAIIAGAIAAALWSYSRLLGPTWARMSLAMVRATLIVLLAALLAGPMLVVRQERVEPDWLLVLVDRSASMQIRDMQVAQRPGMLISRDTALRQALSQQAELFGPQQLGKDRRLLWLAFDSETYQIGGDDDALTIDLPDAEGQNTSIRTAIEQALQRAAGRPVSGVVLFSDGRSPQRTGSDLVRRLEQQAVSVFVVPLGSSDAPVDLAVAQIDAPDRAFVNDTVPVTVWVDSYPADAAVDHARVRVRLVDPVSKRILDEKTPGVEGLNEPIRLSAASSLVGDVNWRVEVSYDELPDAPIQQRELILENNQRNVAVELIDRPLRVLYVDGYPRWEYRYLKNMLMREDSIESSIVLTSADRGFVQEGDIPITRLPNRIEELDPYDVIIIGDMASNYFSSAQLALFRDHVAMRGGGLLLIGGGSHMPRGYEGTVLGGMLPMLRPSAVERLPQTIGPIDMRPAPLSESLNVLSLRTPGETDRTMSWPEHLPALMWAQELGELKPTAQPLAIGYGATGTLGPLVTHMRYGAGQSIYVATDEIWRWRFGRGDLYYDQFWTQLIRMLGRSRIQQDPQRIRLNVSARRVETEQSVVVSLRIDDPLLMKRDMPRVTVAALRGQGVGAEELERIELLPVSQTTAAGDDERHREYRSIWRPTASGRLTLRVVEAALDDLDVRQEVDVISPDDELRQPLPDHDRLTTLATATAGATVPIDQLEELANLVPNRARRTPNDIREPLWNSYLAMTLIVVLLTMEWVGRKAIRLA